MQSFLTHLLLIFLFLGLFSCDQNQIKTVSNTNNQTPDSVKIYYDISHDPSLSMTERMRLIDRSYNLSKEKSPDSVSFVSLNYKAHLHYKTYEIDSAIIYTNEIIEVAQKVKDSAALAKAYTKLGRYITFKNKVDQAYSYFTESKKIYETLKDSLATGQCLLNMAILLCDNGIYGQSDMDALEALVFLKNTHDSVTIGSVYNCMAISAKSQDDFDEALYWYDLAQKNTSNKENAAIYKSNTANIYRERGQYDKAISILEQNLNIARIEFEKDATPNKESNLIRISDNLSYVLWLKNKNQDLEKDFLENLEKRKRNNDLSGEFISHLRLVEFYQDNNINTSIFHAKEAYQIGIELKDGRKQLKALALLIEMSENDYESFKAYSKKYIHLKDSLPKNINNSGNFAKIRFDTERNRIENESLKLEKMERELALEKSKTMNLIYLFLGFISILSFVFIQNFLRTKHKKDKLQKVFETETRISKKVHDEVANDLYKVMTRMETSPDQALDLVDDLELIYEKTRDISRNTNSLNLEEDFKDTLHDLFLEYKTKDVNIITKGLKDIHLDHLEFHKKVGIYRVLQELMTNMKKHSRASLVVLMFKNIKDKIHISYSDDGVGCDLKKRNGLLNVENRIVDLGGKFNLSSEINKGFKAKIVI